MDIIVLNRGIESTQGQPAVSNNPRRPVDALVASSPSSFVESPEGRAVLDRLAHDARNLFSALGLYSDLLGEPGVLTGEYSHYAEQLKVVVTSGVALVERLISLRANAERIRTPHRPSHLAPFQAGILTNTNRARPAVARRHFLNDLGAEIERRKGMLAVLLGGRIALEVECLPCPGAVRLSGEDLGRILMNLVRNAGEAMAGGGRVRVTLQGGNGSSFLPEGSLPSHESKTALLCVEDNGPGIAPEYLQKVFEKGFSTRTGAGVDAFGPPPASRGLGLGIARSLVEAAGGTIRAISRPGAGTRFEMEFPLGPRLTITSSTSNTKKGPEYNASN